MHPVEKKLQSLANPEKARFLQGFFKTKPGEYAHGDVLLGVSVPDQRKIAKKYQDLDLATIEHLIKSPIHEYRLTALIILTLQFEKSDEKNRKAIFDFYLKNTKYINNWDLVDTSAHKIVGEYLLDKDWAQLKKLTTGHLWERRIAMIATLAFINKKQPEPVLEIAQILLPDKHDLIQKAVGWMLREMGKKIGEDALTNFLEKNIKNIGRTTLRYAIERLSKEQKIKFMAKQN